MGNAPSGPGTSEASMQAVKRLIAQHPAVLFSKTTCGFCMRAKRCLEHAGIEPHVVELNQLEDGSGMQAAVASLSGLTTVPNLFVHGSSVGDSGAVCSLAGSGELASMLSHGTETAGDS